MQTAIEVQNQYLDYLEDTECPLLFHRWCFIAGVAALLERKIHFPFGPQTIYPNLYVVLLGPPASRKSTAINALGDLIEHVGYRKFAGDKSGAEKFLEDMYYGFENIDDNLNVGSSRKRKQIHAAYEMMPVDDLMDLDSDTSFQHQSKDHVSAVFVKASEMQTFIGMHNHSFISLLTDMYDNPPHWKNRLKNGDSQLIYNPVVNILGGATSATFQNMFTAASLDQGILSRFLLIHGDKRRKRIAFPRPLSDEKKFELSNHLSRIHETMRGTTTFSEEAENLAAKIYEGWQDIPDVRFSHYGGRRFTILLKLCIINAALRLSLEVDEADVLAANTILTYTEQFMPKALGEFGKTQDGHLVQDIYNKISNYPDGIDHDTVRESVINITTDTYKILSAIESLKSLGKVDIVYKDVPGQEKQKPFLLPTFREKVKTSKYVDYSLLPETKV